MSIINVNKKTSSSNNKQPLINEENKQTNSHNLLIPENTSNSDFVRNDADKNCRQAKAIKKFSIQLDLE